MQILVANAPPAYQEVIATALRTLRPHLGVRIGTPDEIDAVILKEVPQFVICSQLSEVAQAHIPAWLLLYPDGARLAVHSLCGERASVSDLAFDDLLMLIDRAEAALLPR